MERVVAKVMKRVATVPDDSSAHVIVDAGLAKVSFSARVISKQNTSHTFLLPGHTHSVEQESKLHRTSLLC